MRILAHAKINWTLEVTGLRQDGYHLLDMLMQPISLCDRIELSDSESVRMQISGEVLVPEGDNNLAWRAASLLKKKTGYAGGCLIEIEKHIPTGAGLAGGSADAAAVLWGLNRIWNLSLSAEELADIGLSLGADIPFCLCGGLSRVRGIGEKMERLHDGPHFPLIVIQPCEGISTAEIYRLWKEGKTDRILHSQTLNALLSEKADLLPVYPGNDLEVVSRSVQPEIAKAEEQLLNLGAVCAQMSGSGSAVFGIFMTDAEAASAFDRLRMQYDRVYLGHTCSGSLEEVTL